MTFSKLLYSLLFILPACVTVNPLRILAGICSRAGTVHNSQSTVYCSFDRQRTKSSAAIAANMRFDEARAMTPCALYRLCRCKAKPSAGIANQMVSHEACPFACLTGCATMNLISVFLVREGVRHFLLLEIVVL